MSRKIMMGIVGCGNSARNIHYPVLKDRTGQFQVAACCDMDGSRAKEVGKLYNACPYDDLSSFLKHPGLELVLVATRPPSTHADVGLAALDAGKDVVLEKPMCGSHEDGLRLLKKAKDTGKILTVYHNRRWDPDFIEVRWAVEQGFFGNLRIFETLVCGNLTAADWLMDWGVHLIDQVLILGEGKPVEVSCVASFAERAEIASGPWAAFIRFNNGRLGIVSMRIGLPGDYPRFSIMGDQAGCAWPTTRGRMEIEGDEVVTEIPTIHRGRDKESLKPGKVRIPFKPFYQNLYETLTSGAALAVKPEEALLVVDVTLAAIESCKTARAVSLI